MHPNNYVFTRETVQSAIEHLKGKLVSHIPNWVDQCKVKNNKLYILCDGVYKEVIPIEDTDKIIKEFYFNPLTTGNRDKLFARIREIYCGISRRNIMEYLRKQESWQLRQPVHKKKSVFPILTSQPNDIWQMDLIDMRKYSDKGYNWILTVVDLFSKYLFAVQLKQKTDDEVVQALESILKQNKPKKIQSDNGPEFKNKLMHELLKQYKVFQYFGRTYTPQSQGAVERVNRTLKELIFAGFIRGGFASWVSPLQNYVDNINSTVHSTTRFKPNYLANEPKEEDITKAEKNIIKRAQHSTQKPPLLNVGDYVRISKYELVRNNVFFKPLEKWTREVFKIVSVKQPDQLWGQPKYILNNGQSYHGFSLLRIPQPEQIKQIAQQIELHPEVEQDENPIPTKIRKIKPLQSVRVTQPVMRSKRKRVSNIKYNPLEWDLSK